MYKDIRMDLRMVGSIEKLKYVHKMESEKIIMLALALIGIYFVGRFYFGKPVKKPARTYQIIHLPLTDQYIVKHRGKYIRTEYNLCRLDELFFADKYRTEAEAKKEIEIFKEGYYLEGATGKTITI